ncbi:MAG: DUF1566 domain-containing protein [Thermodesulfobacteriota bacterium]|nr:DUF1566 domain-containing protein [Thermodesulfobacteriota bacterium]
MKKLMVGALILMVMLFFGATSFAGSLEDPGSPTTDGGGAMNTLEDIYNILNDGTTNVSRTGQFAEPSAGPAGTGHTLTAVYNRAKTSSRPARTGQTTCYNADGNEISCSNTGQDGELQKGVAWPSPRFTEPTPLDGTVTDNLTGLIWLKNPDCFGQKTWADALNVCNNLANGSCGLTDGSVAGDWRLPNRRELDSLIDLSQSTPVPNTASFSGVQSHYWSSTTLASGVTYAWVYMDPGKVSYSAKTVPHYVWPVRGGQSSED